MSGGPSAGASSTDRWPISHLGCGKKPWVITDTSTNPAEDATLYRFSSRKKADAFKQMLVDEAAKAALAS